MIIGPNGTGKSSIACAICIGLGFAPSLLGRATEMKSYVKLGCTDASIEIELKGPIGERNPVIRRALSNKDDRSKWTLNGSGSTFTAVKDMIAKLNVQVNNLW
jgi:chromosome segregation ATPase